MSKNTQSLAKTEKFDEELAKMLADAEKVLVQEASEKDSPEVKKQKEQDAKAAEKILSDFKVKLETAKDKLGQEDQYEAKDGTAFNDAFNKAASDAITAAKEVGKPTWGQLLTSVFTKFALALTLVVGFPVLLYPPARTWVADVMTAKPHTPTSAGFAAAIQANGLFEPVKPAPEGEQQQQAENQGEQQAQNQGELEAQPEAQQQQNQGEQPQNQGEPEAQQQNQGEQQAQNQGEEQVAAPAL